MRLDALGYSRPEKLYPKVGYADVRINEGAVGVLFDGKYRAVASRLFCGGGREK